MNEINQINNKLINKYNIHIYFALSLLISKKFLSEYPIYLDNYTELLGINLQQIIKLELEFIEILDWKLNINNNKFNIELKYLRKNLVYYRKDILNTCKSNTDLLCILLNRYINKYIINDININL
jgi:hypothetical protein